jgi:DNA-binding LytR/AlgR family response regulator
MLRIKYPDNSQIAYLEADINYTIFHLIDGRRVLSSFTLKRHQEADAHSHFLRINRHVLVNPEYINHVYSEGVNTRVRLINGKDYPVSRRRVAVLDTVVL